MPTTVQGVSTFIRGDLGHCSRCTRKAFLAAVSAWVTTAIALWAEWPQALAIAEVISVGLTALWITHLLAFAGKVSREGHEIRPELLNPSRRAFLPMFARTLAFAAVASTVPQLAFAIKKLVSAPPGWTRTGKAANPSPMRTAQGCQPVSYGCNSCCNDGISGNYFIRSDCSTGCSMGCGNQPCY
jgi:hypothetical protein